MEYGNVVIGDCTRAVDYNLENVELAGASAITGARRFISHSHIYYKTVGNTGRTQEQAEGIYFVQDS